MRTNTMDVAPEYILFAQHGWNDDSTALASLAHAVASPRAYIVLPDLGWLRTWRAVEPLLISLETTATRILTAHPQTPLRIVGHSLGGLLWIDLLDRHQEWWPQVHSLVLLGSPVGGADLARIVDPLGLLPTIARDLGRNRRPQAERIAATIPTLVIAGDDDGGSDRVIVEGATVVPGAQHHCMVGLWHNDLRDHPALYGMIRRFWGETEVVDERDAIIARLRIVPGMTDAHGRDVVRARTLHTCTGGLTIRTWRNPLGVDHVFVVDAHGTYLYGGFVGWMHAHHLDACLHDIAIQYGCNASRLSRGNNNT